MLSTEWQIQVGRHGCLSHCHTKLVTSQPKTFTMGQKLPVSVILHYKDGRYSIDADKSIDLTSDSNVLGAYVRGSPHHFCTRGELIGLSWISGALDGEAIDDRAGRVRTLPQEQQEPCAFRGGRPTSVSLHSSKPLVTAHFFGRSLITPSTDGAHGPSVPARRSERAPSPQDVRCQNARINCCPSRPSELGGTSKDSLLCTLA